MNTRITPANVHDMDVILDTVRDIEKRLCKLPEILGLDAGYHSAQVCHRLIQQGIQPVIGYRRHTHKGERYGKYRFRYDPERNVYHCPEHHELTWRTTNRDGYREYACDSKTCKACPRRSECLSTSSTRRTVTRHVWQDDLEQVDAFTKTHKGKALYRLRKILIELSFAEAKKLHGLRYARMLGIQNMREQAFLTATVQNMMRIACFFGRLRSLLLSYWWTAKPLLVSSTWTLSTG